MLDKLRRIVTGHDAQGRSVVLEDAVLTKRKGPASRGVTEVWNTDPQPIDSQAFADPVNLPFELIPRPGGSKFLFFAVAPESADGDDETAKARAAAAFASYGADAARPDTSISPWMHKTKTIDYIIVLKGEVTLLLEGEERTLKPFDVVIQRGTNHAWINRGAEPALLIAILIDADYSG